MNTSTWYNTLVRKTKAKERKLKREREKKEKMKKKWLLKIDSVSSMMQKIKPLVSASSKTFLWRYIYFNILTYCNHFYVEPQRPLFQFTTFNWKGYLSVRVMIRKPLMLGFYWSFSHDSFLTTKVFVGTDFLPVRRCKFKRESLYTWIYIERFPLLDLEINYTLMHVI